jgi:hypothetical protein
VFAYLVTASDRSAPADGSNCVGYYPSRNCRVRRWPPGPNGVAAGFSVDAFLLLFVFGQKDFYLSLLREMRVLPAAKVRFRPQAWQDSDAGISGQKRSILGGVRF